MNVIPIVVIVPLAENESDALGEAEEILEVSAVDPYGEGEWNEEGMWESYALGWDSFESPVNIVTGEKVDAVQLKNLEVENFFFSQGSYAEYIGDEEDDDEEVIENEMDFLPEALILSDGTWVDSYSLSEGDDWKTYFMETLKSLPGDNWLVFVKAAI